MKKKYSLVQLVVPLVLQQEFSQEDLPIPTDTFLVPTPSTLAGQLLLELGRYFVDDTSCPRRLLELPSIRGKDKAMADYEHEYYDRVRLTLDIEEEKVGKASISMKYDDVDFTTFSKFYVEEFSVKKIGDELVSKLSSTRE